jgi:hypothetical protein
MIPQTQPLALAPSNGRGLQLNTLDDVLKFAGIVIKSGLAPKSFDTPEKVVLAIVQGSELGVSPLQALQGLTVTSGRIGIMGDLALALCESQPEFEDSIEEWIGTQGSDDWGCRITVKRRGRSPRVGEFTVAQAKLAGLWGKRTFKGEPTPWVSYPKRMLRYRALGFVLRDAFPDVLKGVKTTEELEDYPEEAKNGFEHAKPIMGARVTDAPANGNGVHSEEPSKENGNGNVHSRNGGKLERIDGFVSRAWNNSYQGKHYWFVRMGDGTQLQTSDPGLGERLKSLATGVSLTVMAEHSPKPGKYYVKSIESDPTECLSQPPPPDDDGIDMNGVYEATP